MTPPAPSVFWQRSRPPVLPPLVGHVEADFAIVGGGIAGLHAARALLEQAPGSRVVLVESEFCGSGASGRSSGFFTPDSELQVSDLSRRFGEEAAGRLWRAVDECVQSVRQEIAAQAIACDTVDADCLFVANGEAGLRTVEREHRDRRRLGLSSRLYGALDLAGILGGGGFTGAVRYGGTFGIDSFAYVRALRDLLMSQGVRVFEGTPVLEVRPHGVICPRGSVSAETLFLCTDRFAPELGIERKAVSHVQTALVVTEPLSDRLADELFPDAPLMVWDTDLVYQYFRPIGENRLLIGGGVLSRTYSSSTRGSERIVAHLDHYVRTRFPLLKNVGFEHWWPGMIGVTKDFLPVAGRRVGVPSHAVALCGTGLPWSVLAARVAVQSVLKKATEYDAVLAPGRAFTDLDVVQPAAGKRATFALSHVYAKRWLRGAPERVRQRRWMVRTALGLAAAALLAGSNSARRSRR